MAMGAWRVLDTAVKRNKFRQQSFEGGAILPFAEARARLPEPVLPDKPEWVEMYWRAWEIAWGNLRRPKPGSGLIAAYVNTADAPSLSLWEATFVTQFGIYGRRAFDFRAMLDNFYARQHDDGFICRQIDRETGQDAYCPFDPNSTGPNILAWAEWRYYRSAGNEARLGQVFWPLLGFHHWMQLNRTWPSGLSWATGVSSGMSNQPRVPDSMYSHRHWTWVDASMQAAVNCQMLEQLATVLQETELARELAAEHTRLVGLINAQLWNPEIGFYQDMAANGRFSKVKSIGAYWGLLGRQLIPADRLGPFVQHLRDNWSFNLPHRVPTQAADSEGYNAATGNQWRGAVSPATNFMVLKGLRTMDLHKLALEIAQNHLTSVCEVYRHTDTFWENYAPETAVPGDPARPNFVGTAGLSPIAILLEDIIGLHADWPLRRLTWDRRLDTNETFGVRNYPWGPDGTVHLIGNRERIQATTDVPFTLHIREDGQLLQAAIPAGTTEIDLS